MTRSEQKHGFAIGGPAGMAGLLILLVTAVAAQAQTFQVLHTFTGQGDGANPYAGLTVDRGGRLYGTTGGGYGSIFKFALSGPGWVLNPLHDFSEPVRNGDVVFSKVIIGPDGNLYGTTWQGGEGDCQEGGGCGTVFKLQPPPSSCKSFLCPWRETVLYRFSGGSDGANPNSEVVLDNAGNLYGTTVYGGNGQCNNLGCGVVYELTPSNGGWTESVIHNFAAGTDGALPLAGLIFDQAGSLYGAAAAGGSAGAGIIYELTPSGGGWTETILHTFQGSDGSFPPATLIADQAGNFYGVTADGGSAGGGTVFELSPTGNWTFTLLYSFPSSSDPQASLVLDSSGNLYGTTYLGGVNKIGTVFKLSRSNGGWTETDLHVFGGVGDGAFPMSSLSFDANGNLYGTASDGGGFLGICDQGCGTVFEITP